MIPYELLKIITPAAFAAMLLFSCLLYRQTRHPHFSIQALGFAMLFAAQIVMIVAYRVYVPEFDSGGGMLESEPRNIALAVSAWASVLGFLIAALGYALQCLGVGRRANGTQLINQADR